MKAELYRHTVKAQADRIATLFGKHDGTLKDLRSRLDEVNRRVTAGNNLLLKLVSSARTDWFMQLGHDLKTLMLKIMAVNLVTYAAVDKVQTLSWTYSVPCLR